MSRPAVFFDRDNTLIANSEYLGDPERVVLLPGAAQAVARSRRLGFATVVVSNQSGVARGMFSEDDVRAVNAKMDGMLLAEEPDALIDLHEFCPFHPEGTVEAYAADHERRKPKPGMLFDAARTLDLDLKKSWLIGDAPRDIEAGRRAGCRTILVKTTLESESPAAAERMRHAPDYTATSLQDAVDFIEMQMDSSRATISPVPMNYLAPASPPAPTNTPAASTTDREQVIVLERILDELRRGNEPQQDFSIARMLAGIMQGFALAAFFGALLYRDTPPTFNMIILVAIFLQALVCGLVLLGR